MPSSSAPSTRRMLTIAPGGDQRLVEADLLPALELRRPRLGSSAITFVRGPQLDAVLLVPVGRVDVGVLALRLAAQVLLRERRALVRRLGLAADEQDRAVGALLAQLRRAVGGGQPAADDQEVDVAIGHPPAPTRYSAATVRGRSTRSAPPRPAGRARRGSRRRPAARSRRSARSRCPRAAREISRLPSGIVEVADPLARPRASPRAAHLDDLEPLLGQVEQVDEAVLGHLVLDQAQDQVGRRDEGLDPEQLEVLAVARVVDPGDDPRRRGTSPSPPGRSACCPRRRR